MCPELFKNKLIKNEKKIEIDELKSNIFSIGIIILKSINIYNENEIIGLNRNKNNR